MLVGGASLLGQTLRERNETRTDICTIMIDAVGIAHPTEFTSRCKVGDSEIEPNQKRSISILFAKQIYSEKQMLGKCIKPLIQIHLTTTSIRLAIYKFVGLWPVGGNHFNVLMKYVSGSQVDAFSILWFRFDTDFYIKIESI